MLTGPLQHREWPISFRNYNEAQFKCYRYERDCIPATCALYQILTNFSTHDPTVRNPIDFEDPMMSFAFKLECEYRFIKKFDSS